MAEKVKRYSSDEVTVIWKPEKCVHSEKCFRGLPEVFNPEERPWVKIEGAATEDIVNQVRLCPSGALSFEMENNTDMPTEKSPNFEIEVMPDGPLMLYGEATVKLKDGKEVSRSKSTAFCRCGLSGNKPFCDGSHTESDFDK